MSKKNVEELLDILKCNNTNLNGIDSEQISEEYNRRLVFEPGKDFHQFIRTLKFIKFKFTDDPRLCYSIREQICVGVWPNPKGFDSRGYANNLYVKSRCIDASKYE